MVYATLQLISRSRDEGISVLEIGKKLRTDQKTCYHLVKQLLELDLMYVYFVSLQETLILTHFSAQSEATARRS